MAALADTPWPLADLESVPHCPACGGAERQAWITGLEDNVFACAPGRWNLARCTRCDAAWLDPRPNASSLMRAYARYYTHENAEADPGRRQGIKAALRNGYLNWRWGYDAAPAWRFGRHFVSKSRRAALDLQVRHLPKPQGKARILDAGCGNGAFLTRMRSFGWDVHGLDPDAAAARAAKASGIDVLVGTLADAVWPDGFFDAVTLSSVIEHVPDPVAALAACRRLLAPGGVLHLVTPNTQALGAERFGVNWRGFEAPRHLVLFDPRSLSLLLEAQGFENPIFHPHFVGEWFFTVSGAMAAGLSPDASGSLPRATRRALRDEGRAADRRVARDPSRAEELVVTARRPPDAR